MDRLVGAVSPGWRKIGVSRAVRLRKSNGDEDRIMSAWREASRAGHPFLREEDLDAQERLTRREHLPLADIVVAELDGQIVGFKATLGEEVGGLFVSPAVQRPEYDGSLRLVVSEPA